MTQYNIRMKMSRQGEAQEKGWEGGLLVHAEDPMQAEEKALSTAAENREDVHRILSVKEVAVP